MTTTSSRNPAIDSLRGISVLIVCWHHFDYFFGTCYVPNFLLPLKIQIAKLAALGFLGVDIFFALSGFLIARVFLLKDEPHPLVRFYLGRFLKIIPQYILLLVAAIFLVGFGVYSFPVHLLPSVTFDLKHLLTLTQNYSSIENSLLAHTWSLCVEEHFYLIFPIAFLFLLRRFSRRKVALVLGMVVVSLIALRSYLWGESHSFNSHHETHVRLDGLLAGATMALIVGRYLFQVAPVLVLSWLTLLLVHPYEAYPNLHHTLASLASCAMVGCLSLNRGTPNWLLRVLHPLSVVGQWSYGVYLWHYPLLFVLLKAGTPHSIYGFGAFLVISISLGKLSTDYWEKRFLNQRSLIAEALISALPVALKQRELASRLMAENRLASGRRMAGVF